MDSNIIEFHCKQSSLLVSHTLAPQLFPAPPPLIKAAYTSSTHTSTTLTDTNTNELTTSAVYSSSITSTTKGSVDIYSDKDESDCDIHYFALSDTTVSSKHTSRLQVDISFVDLLVTIPVSNKRRWRRVAYTDDDADNNSNSDDGSENSEDSDSSSDDSHTDKMVENERVSVKVEVEADDDNTPLQSMHTYLMASREAISHNLILHTIYKVRSKLASYPPSSLLVTNGCNTSQPFQVSVESTMMDVSSSSSIVTTVIEASSSSGCSSGRSDNRTAAALLKRKITSKLGHPPPAISATLDHIVSETVSSTTMASQTVFELPTPPPPSPRDVEVVFLGTGSAAPSNYRSNSGILLRIPTPSDTLGAAAPTFTTAPSSVSVLLDAGEGIVRQLHHHTSGDIARFEVLLLSIRVVWISHHHADHLCGLTHLIQTIYSIRLSHAYVGLTFTPILVYLSSQCLPYIEYAVNISGLDEVVELHNINESTFAGVTSTIQTASYNCIQKLVSVPVIHCKESYGVVLTLYNNLKIVYSGDCRPSPTLINAGKHCDLLIHEATFADDCTQHAIDKRHCTTTEALSVARQMCVRGLTVLTHFSQRYSITSQDLDSDILCMHGIAYDNLHFYYPSQRFVLPIITQRLGRILTLLNTHASAAGPTTKLSDDGEI